MTDYDVIFEIAGYVGGVNFRAQLRENFNKYHDTGSILEMVKLEVIRKNRDMIKVKDTARKLWKELHGQGGLFENGSL